jgi:hypothetical protein
MKHKTKQIYVYMLSDTYYHGMKTIPKEPWTCGGCGKTVETETWAQHLLDTNCPGYWNKWWLKY